LASHFKGLFNLIVHSKPFWARWNKWQHFQFDCWNYGCGHFDDALHLLVARNWHRNYFCSSGRFAKLSLWNAHGKFS